MPHATSSNSSAPLPLGTRIYVERVDIFGFCGRDNHPVRSDRGRVGTVVACEWYTDLDEDDQPTMVYVYGCVLDTDPALGFNDIRDFMDFEIAPLGI